MFFELFRQIFTEILPKYRNLPEKIEKLNIDIQEIHTENRKLRATLDQVT